jgi:hypothetical protein
MSVTMDTPSSKPQSVRVYRINSGQTNWEGTIPADGAVHVLTTSHIAEPYDFHYNYKTIQVSLGIIEGDYAPGAFGASILDAQLWNLDANRPPLYLGAPAWEPKVYRADGTWK